MNTTKIISASGAIAMTAMLFSGIAAMSDRNLSPIGDAVAVATSVATPIATAVAAPLARDTITVSATKLVGQAVVKVAANAPTPSHRQGDLDHATISKWNRLTGSPDVQTMLA